MSFEIIGTGMYVPEKVVTNDDLAKIVDTNDEWIKQRVGISERRVSTNETASEMGYKAAVKALEDADITAQELDLILVATVSGETVSPSMSCMIQNRLGATCMAYDINAACSAFLFLLETAAGYFARKKVSKVLVVGTERMSGIIDWDDRSTCVIFGDGAGAAVLQTGDNYLDSTFTVKGGNDVINIPHYVGKSPFYTIEGEEPYVMMKGQETFKFAVNAICSDIQELLDRNNLTADDIKYIVPHQANMRIIDFASRKLKIPMEKFMVNIERFGNTSSASIPMVLDEYSKANKLEKGDLLLMCAFGGGLAHAACLIRW
ncbi:MAG: beta-ketoacyl-ACP synthase III [Acutalibacteraceae bacterium]